MMKRFFFFSFCVCLSVLGIKIAYFFTEGFRVDKVLFPKELVIRNQEKTIQEEKILKEILSQPFFYLGKGRQAYAFESADHQYVFKLSREHKYQRPIWTKVFSPFLTEERKQILREQEIRLERAITSYEIAYGELREESQLFYLHLFPTDHLQQKIHLKDRLGRNFFVNLDDLGFLVQRKGIPFREVLLDAKEDTLKVQKLLSAFMQHTAFRMKKRFLNRDFLRSLRNVGIYQKENQEFVMEIDVGSFYRCEEFDFSFELRKELDPLQKFVLKFFPEQKDFFDQKLESLCTQ